MSDSQWMWVEIGCTVVIPTATMWFGPDLFGPGVALILALLCPLLFSLANLRREGQVSVLSALAMGSILLTGVVGLMSFDARWFALKEALIPALMGAVLVLTARTRYAVVPALIERVLDRDKLRGALVEPSAGAAFERVAVRATFELGVVMAASGILSLMLARWVVTAPSGSDLFVEQLGTYTAWSFPAVTLPVLLATGWVLRRALEGLERVAAVPLEQLLKS
jgi:prepilin signal peptidase PulO-like enzyme (type II secretory pathway)